MHILLVTLLLAALGCGDTLPDHTHGLITHAHAAHIVSINPPVDHFVPPVGPGDANVGLLPPIGWQTITITFSDPPSAMSVQLLHYGEERLSGWTLKDRVLTMHVFCDGTVGPKETYKFWLNWDSGFIVLNYYCPAKKE